MKYVSTWVGVNIGTAVAAYICGSDQWNVLDALFYSGTALFCHWLTYGRKAFA